MDNDSFLTEPARHRVVADLVRVTRVLVLALPVVNLTDDEEHHINRLARYLIAEAERKNPDVQRIQLLGSLLRNQLAQGPAAATLGAVLADSFDEALNGPAEPLAQSAPGHLAARGGRRQPTQRQPAQRQPAQRRVSPTRSTGR